MKSFLALLLVVLATFASNVLSDCNLKTELILNVNDKVYSEKTADFLSTIENKTAIKVGFANIDELCVEFIKHFQGVENLAFGLAGINYIEPGTFHFLTGLKLLEIKHNYLVDISSGIFSKLKLEHLNLKGNGISYIAPDAFEDMANLKTLNLDFNKLTNFDSSWFQRARSINELSMVGNLLTTLPDKAFEYFNVGKKCNGDHDLSKNDCPVFVFSYNRFDTIDASTFEGIDKIKSLYLDNNDLDNMPALNVEIREVSLQYNDIVEVKQDVLADYVASYTINTTYIHGNPLSKRSIIYLDTANDAYKNSFVYKSRMSPYTSQRFEEGLHANFNHE